MKKFSLIRITKKMRGGTIFLSIAICLIASLPIFAASWRTISPIDSTLTTGATGPVGAWDTFDEVVATNTVATNWGGLNVSSNMYVTWNSSGVYIGVAGRRETANELVIFVDRDYGSANGAGNRAALTDVSGELDTTITGCGGTCGAKDTADWTDTNFKPDFAIGVAANDTAINNVRVWNPATGSDWSTGDTTNFGWFPTLGITGDNTAGNYEYFIPWEKLYGTLSTVNSKLALAVMIGNNGSHSNQHLPEASADLIAPIVFDVFNDNADTTKSDSSWKQRVKNFWSPAGNTVGRTAVYINEVMPHGALTNTGTELEDWVELFTGANSTISLNGWQLVAYGPTTYTITLPNVNISSGGFVVLHPRPGSDYTDTFGVRHYYFANNDWFEKDSGAVALFRNSVQVSSTIIDFVEWDPTGGIGASDFPPRDDIAAAAGIWGSDDAVDVAASGSNFNRSIGLTKDGVRSSTGAGMGFWSQFGTTGRSEWSEGTSNNATNACSVVSTTTVTGSDYGASSGSVLAGSTLYFYIKNPAGTGFTANASVIQSLPVRSTSTSDPTGILLNAYEVNASSDIYRGVIRLVETSPSTSAMDALYAVSGDKVSVFPLANSLSVSSMGFTVGVGNNPPSAPSGLAQYVGNFVSLSSNTWTQFTQVRATFTLTDPDSPDSMQFNIHVSSKSDFSFLFITSTNPATATLAQAATNFLTSQSQSLIPDGTWYWRVKARDNSSADSAYTAMNSGGIAFRIDTASPTTVTPSVTRLSSSAIAMQLTWSAATDATSGVIGYRIYRSTLSEGALTDANRGANSAKLIASTTTLPLGSVSYTDAASALQPNTSYYWAVTAVDAAGLEASVSNASEHTPRIAIDGAASDWVGTLPSSTNSATISSGEWIWNDKLNEQRNDDTNPASNYDIQEVRVTADEEYMYFLLKWRNITNADLTYFAVAVDTDQISAQSYGNWIADDSLTQLGGDSGNDRYANFSQRAERQIIVHRPVATGVHKIELFAPPDGTSWFAPPTAPNADGNFYSGNMIEFKISRNDLGLAGNKTARLSFATYKAANVWANTGDSTAGTWTPNALDSVSIVRLSSGSGAGQYYNDPANNQSSWDEDLSDSDVDFWVDVPVVSTGIGVNVPPTTVGATPVTPILGDTITATTPTLQWSAASDPDSGDAVTSYLIEFSTWTNLSSAASSDDLSANNAYGWRVNVTGLSWAIPSALGTPQSYFWRVWSRDRRGALSATPNLWNFRVDNIAPNNISDLTALSGSNDGDVQLNWTSPGNDGTSNAFSGTYRIRYSTTSFSLFLSTDSYNLSFSTSGVTPLTQVGKVITGLNPGTTYFFGMIAGDGVNWNFWKVGGAVNSLSSAAARDLSLSAPTNISALGGDVSSTSIKISWIPPSPPANVDDRANYRLYVATYSFVASTDAAVVMSSEVTHPLASATTSSLSPNTTYFFRVSAVDSGTVTSGLYSASLESPLSALYSTPTWAAIPTTAAFAVSDVGSSSITFRWGASGNSSGTFYQANISSSSDFVLFSASATSGGLSITTATLPSLTTYFFRVRARNWQNLFTDWSPTVSTKTLIGDTSAPAAITDLSATQGSNGGEINLSWTATGDDGNTGNITGGKYRLDYSTDSAHSFVVTTYQIEFSSDIVQGQSQGRVVTGLTQGSTYFIRVYTADEVPNWSAVSNGATTWAKRSGGGDGTEAMTLYFSSAPTNSDPTKPGFRTFDGTNWASVGFAVSGGKEASGFQVVRPKPSSNERAAGFQMLDGGIKFMVWDGAASPSWGNFVSASNDTTVSGQRKFDIAYEEGGGGEAICVYRSSDAGNTPWFTRWDGTKWSAASTISGWILSSAVQWIRLFPKPNSDEILAVALQGNSIASMVWDGGAWGNYKNLTVDLGNSENATATTVEPFDATYQGNGTGFVVWGSTTGTLYIATYTAAGGWATVAQSSKPAQVTGTGSSALRWIKAKPRPKTNELTIAAAEGTPTAGSADLQIWLWNGTALSAYSEVDTDIQAESGVMGTRHFDVAYERTSGHGMVLWASASSPVKFRQIISGAIGSEQNGPSWPNGLQISWLSLAQDQSANSNNLYLLMASSGGALNYARWNGSSWETTQTFESAGNALSPNAESFSLTSKWASLPAVDSSIPGAISNLTALQSAQSELTLNWSAPGDNQETGDLPSGSLFRIKYSSVGIINSANFDSSPASLAVKSMDLSTSATAGSKQGTIVTGLLDGATYWFAIKTRDNADNWSIWNSSADVSSVNVLLSTWALFDTTPPGAITDLSAALTSNFTGIVKLSWSAPHEDGAVGGASSLYQVRYATSDFSQADWNASWVSAALSTPTPSSPGAQDSMNVTALASGVTYYFHIRSLDERSNISNLDSGTPAQSRVQHILISEVMADGSPIDSEFVELHNPTTDWYSFSGWRLTKKTSGGTESNLAATFSGLIPPKGYYLIGSAEYNLSVSTDASYTTANRLAGTNNTVLLYSDAGVTLVDKVGYGSGSADFELVPASNPVASGSIERKANSNSSSVTMGSGGSDANAGNSFDANNNNLEFSTRTIADPQNSKSSPKPDQSAPSRVTDLTALPGPSSGKIKLSWTSPGDDGSVGTAASYIIKMATSSELSPALSDANFNAAQNVNSTSPVPSPLAGGTSVQSMIVTGLQANVTYYFAMKARDEVPNDGALSNGGTSQIPVISISVNTTFYQFGFLGAQVSSISAQAITITNGGNVNENYILRATTATPGTPWSIATSSGLDSVVLYSIFNPSRPSDAQFNAEDILTLDNQNSSSSIFSDGSQTGVAVPPSTNRDLWFRLLTPLGTSTDAEQILKVTITAEQSP